MTAKPIVIIGGSAAGLEAALHLDALLGHDIATPIYLIDPSPYHTFVPHIVELLRSRSPRVVNIPFATLLKGTRIQHVQAEVTHVDVEHKTVTTAHKKFRYNDLIVAVENQPWPNDIKTDEYGALLTCDTANDILEVRAHILEQLTATKEKKAPFEVLVVGGGVKGVEFIAGLCDFFAYEKQRNPRLKPIFFVLAESESQLLPGQSVELNHVVREYLLKRGVTIKQNARMTLGEIKQKLKQSHSGDRTVVWAVGNRAHPIVAKIKGLPHDQSGRLHVESTLQVQGHDTVWAAGESATANDYSWESSRAQGKHIARMLINQRKSGGVYAYYNQSFPTYIELAPHFGIAAQGNQIHEGTFPVLVKRWQRFRYLFSLLPFLEVWRLWWTRGEITHDTGLVCYRPHKGSV